MVFPIMNHHKAKTGERIPCFLSSATFPCNSISKPSLFDVLPLKVAYLLQNIIQDPQKGDSPKNARDNPMKYLNSKIEDLMYGRKVTYRGKVYWANRTAMEIYSHSVDDEILGSITGYKVADITHDFKIVKCSG